MPLGTASAQIDVVATTPLPGSDLSLKEIPAQVQTANKEDIEASGALDLADLLNRRLSGVNVNDNQENPFQPDVNYRGYTASPLLGTPQGISVYMDGVRQNQPFGDVVSWDLIPRIAISEVALIAGSNPLFGLNTLGGAISIETKDGRSQPGTTIQVNGGSYGRRAVEFEHGGSNKKALGLELVRGAAICSTKTAGAWIRPRMSVRRSASSSGKARRRRSVALGFAYADNALYGNGLQEQRFLARNYASGYTLGDVTMNRSPFFNLMALRHAASGALTCSGNAYFRYIRADTLNPNLNTNALDQSLYTAQCRRSRRRSRYCGIFGISGERRDQSASNTPFPSWRCIAQALRLADPSDNCDSAADRPKSYSKQE